MCMSYMTTPIYPRLLFDYRITSCLFRYLDKIIISEMPLLNFSGMAGRGANGPPPPPDYMAAMMQQFQMNQVFMQGVIDQLQNQNQNQNQHQNQPPVVTLRDFMRLNPLSSTNLNNHWMPMIGFVTSTVSWSSLM